MKKTMINLYVLAFLLSFNSSLLAEIGGGFGNQGAGFSNGGGFGNINNFGGFGGGFGGGGGGFSGGGMGGAFSGGGQVKYEKNEKTDKILDELSKKSEETLKESTEKRSKEVQEGSAKAIEGMQKISDKEASGKEEVSKLEEVKKKSEEEIAALNEQSKKDSGTQRERILSLINQTSKVIEKTLKIIPQEPERQEAEQFTNAEVASSRSPQNFSPSNLNGILQARDLGKEKELNNTTPPVESQASSESEGHNHGFKAAPKAYNAPTNNNF